MFRFALILAVVCAALLSTTSASTAIAQTREAQKEQLEKYLDGAGAPVDKFTFYKLQKWELVGDNRVVVWTRVNHAYLLTLENPCVELPWTSSIALTSSAHQVHVRFDYVLVENGRRCEITEIRPLAKDAL